MALWASSGGSAIDEANARMIGDFFAGIDVRAALDALRAIARTGARTSSSARPSSSPARSSPSCTRSRSHASASAWQSTEELAIELAAPAVDRARAGLGLPADPAGERLRCHPVSHDGPRGSSSTRSGRAARPPCASPAARRHHLRAAARLVARQRRPARLPHLRLGRRGAAPALLPHPVPRGDRRARAAAGPRPADDRRRPRPRRARSAAGQRPRRALGRARPRRARRPRSSSATAATARRWARCATACRSSSLPLFSVDQWANAAAVAAAGAGHRARRRARDAHACSACPRAATVGELGPAVRRVLEDPSYRAGAARIADAMAALPPVDAAVDTLAALSRLTRV